MMMWTVMRMYTGIKSSTKGFRDIKYPLEDKRDQERERVAGFACGGGVIDTLNTKGLRKQFKYVWDKGNRPEGTIQAYKYLMSFSKNELNPDDPASAEKALEIAREVMEETGLKVKNVTYYKSQPWGIANDMLTGYYCEADGSAEIKIDKNELKLALWKLPAEIELQPDSYSLTNEMMRMFKEHGVFWK